MPCFCDPSVLHSLRMHSEQKEGVCRSGYVNRKWSVTPRLAAGNYADPHGHPYQLGNARKCKFSRVFRSPARIARVCVCIATRLLLIHALTCVRTYRMKRKKARRSLSPPRGGRRSAHLDNARYHASTRVNACAPFVCMYRYVRKEGSKASRYA